MSLAFTLLVSTRRFTRVTSPFLQASSSSRNAPLAAPGPAASGLSAAGLDAADDDADDEDEDEEEPLELLPEPGGGAGAAEPEPSAHSTAGGRSESGGASPSGPERLWRCAAGARLGLRGGDPAAGGGDAGPGGGGGWCW